METSHTVAIIPARLESTRLPRKLLKPLSGKSLLQRVYENTCRFDLFQAVYIASDSDEVIKAADSFGAKSIRTSKTHTSGTSRLAEAFKAIPHAEIFVNIQGDEPFLKKDQIERLISDFKNNPDAQIATLYFSSMDPAESMDPNIVKVVKNHKQEALYFSRYPIPYIRDKNPTGPWLHHIGVYAYRRSFLEIYPTLKECELEKKEKLEQLRFLTNGYKILLTETFEKTIGIDTQEDFLKAEKFLQEHPSPSNE